MVDEFSKRDEKKVKDWDDDVDTLLVFVRKMQAYLSQLR